MTRPLGIPTTATGLQLLLTAERLFAEHGLDGVPSRQIALEAGSANNSAVGYYFGSRERLVQAIFDFRLPQLLERRRLLRARVPAGDLRARLEAHLLPLLEMAESHDCSYLSFLEQLQRHSEMRRLLSKAKAMQSQEEFVAEVAALLPAVPEPVRALRIGQVQLLTLHTAAERERTGADDPRHIPFGLFVDTFIDGCVGYLTAPVSDQTRRGVQQFDARETVTPPRLV